MNTDRQSSTYLQTQFSNSRKDSQAKLAKPTKRSFRSPSIGARLFIFVMGGALVGLGGMSFFFYRTLLQTQEAQIQTKLSTVVGLTESQLTPVKQHVLAFNTAVQTLHAQGTKSEALYQQLTFNFLQQRPNLSFGMGFGQTAKAIVPESQWFFPYYYQDQKVEGQIGKRLPAPYQNIFYSELATDDNYYDNDYYKIPARTQKALWMEPYSSYGALITTYAAPIFNHRHQVIGVSNLDVNVLKLTEQINIKQKVLNNQGYFALLSAEGRIIAYPPAQPTPPAEGEKGPSYSTISQLKAVWPQLQQGQSGLIHAKGNYWAYQRLPSTNWLMLAAVPQSVVLTPVLTITLAGTVGASLLLAAIVLLFVRDLNRRLQPILDECNKLAETDAQTQDKMQDRDELGRLSTSFYNLLAQVTTKEEQIRQEAAARLIEAQERLQLATAAQQEGEALQTEVGHILDVVSAVETGDLTVQAQVSDRATGLVADTLNRLIEELARIMAIVLSTAQQVTQGAEELEQLASSTAGQAQRQAHFVSKVQAQIVNFSDLSQETAQQALVSDESVQQAIEAVDRGQQEIATMTDEIEVLQQGTEQIVRRAEMLTNFVASAAQFAKDQKRVAALTRVLALNASMIAARASGQQDPEQFASIASEFEAIATQVNELAIETNQSLLLLQQRTDQIQTVVSGINQDVNEISKSVNQFTLSVDRSGQVFDNIKSVTDRVAQLGQQVSKSSQAIATTARSTLHSIQEIATVAVQTESRSRFTREQAGAINRLAHTLLERVRFFRISTDSIEATPVTKALPVALKTENPDE